MQYSTFAATYERVENLIVIVVHESRRTADDSWVAHKVVEYSMRYMDMMLLDSVISYMYVCRVKTRLREMTLLFPPYTHKNYNRWWTPSQLRRPMTPYVYTECPAAFSRSNGKGKLGRTARPPVLYVLYTYIMHFRQCIIVIH